MAQVLLLVRHGKAEDKHPSGDASRALTEKGRDSFRKHAKSLTHLCRLKGIATSSLVRAVQTAELLANAFSVDEVTVAPELRPSSGSPRLIHLAHSLGPGFALVGHNPTLSLAAAKLLGLHTLPFTFKKGAALALHKDGDAFRFAWFYAPGKDVVRDLADFAKK